MSATKKRNLLTIVDKSDEPCALSGETKNVFFAKFSDGLSGPMAWQQILRQLERRLAAPDLPTNEPPDAAS